MKRDFWQAEWDERTQDDCRQVIRLAVREDLDRSHDLTTMALVPPESSGSAQLVARQPGVAAGLVCVPLLIDEMNLKAAWSPAVSDGDTIRAGDRLGTLRGQTRDLLTAERTLLNMLGRLCGVATWTRRFVDAVAGTAAAIYDTRKTTPGWRRMEKYAVRCGGARNHRMGLYDAVLIKDNHLAQASRSLGMGLSPAAAVQRAREFLQEYTEGHAHSMLIEVEVDTVAQFAEALTAQPDLILLDNMSLDDLRTCVRQRSELQPSVELEASGGISLANVRAVAETGVDRISLGALTHSAISLDVALDWDVEG